MVLKHDPDNHKRDGYIALGHGRLCPGRDTDFGYRSVDEGTLMAELSEQIRRAILGRNPLVYIHSSEEDRIIALIGDLARETADGAWPVRQWSCVTGLDGATAGPDTRDPLAALQVLLASRERGFFVMKDLAGFLTQPQVVRALRDFYYNNRGRLDRFLFIVGPELVIPEGLRKELHLVEAPPPGEPEISREIDRVMAGYPGVGIPDEHRPEIVLALKGMTLAEIDHVLHRIFQAGEQSQAATLNEIFNEKEMVVSKAGFLEFCPPRLSVANIGGLANLKDWLARRKALFSQEAIDAGVPTPKGLLIMGVSGCGKSLAVKAISSLWNVPLFRLDMNLVFSGLHGSPEAAFHQALKTVETVAPAVLWIDEIENSLGMTEDSIEMASHIFSAFLTWMQEKPPLIFIAATANRIHALPAEVIRKGRFDQVFFVDLPDDVERREVLEIHLRLNGGTPDDFDLKMLVIQMDGWSGAEIEQAVVSARIDAYAENRPFNMRDVNAAVARIVPLSKTMEAQIKGIRDWAFDRATPASRRSRRGAY